MDDQKKLAFVHNMTHLALMHVRKPVPPPQHFDQGGGVSATSPGPTSSTMSTPGIGGIGNVPQPVQNLAPGWAQGPLNTVQSLNPISQLQNATQNQFQATSANIQPGTNAGQLNDAYDQAQRGITQQQGLVNSLQGQNGIGNQSNVFNQEQGLSNQLQNQVNGEGPNPAQAQLAQNTGTNVANQAALMAGQRGAGANPALIAREAAQQGAATQQGAVGQAATLQAQQQLAAEGALQNNQNNMANLATNQVNAVGQAIGGLNTSGQNEQNILQNANTSANNAAVSNQSNLNNVNAGVSEGNQTASNNLLGGLMNGAGSAASSLFAKGGVVGGKLKTMNLPSHLVGMAKIYHPQHFDDGGEVQANLGSENYTASSPSSAPGQGSVSAPNEGDPFAPPSSSGGGGGGGGGIMSLAALAAAHGGVIPNMGTRLKSGGQVPGKPKVGHDAYKNDTVSASLTPGEVVIDLDTLKRNDKLGKMARYVAQNMARKKVGRKA
jgi:hypothetical protein